MPVSSGGPAVLIVGLLFAGRLFDSSARAPRMAAATIESVTLPEGGGVTVVYGDSNGRTFTDRAELIDAAQNYSGSLITADFPKNALLLRWHADNPALDNAAAAVGLVCEVNWQSNIAAVQFGRV
jgi:hypothetical protein